MLQRFFSAAGKTLVILLLAGLTFALGASVFFINAVKGAPVPSAPYELKTKSAIRIVASDGTTPIATIQPPDGTREIVSSKNISPYIKDALIAAEDASFDTNFGFSPKRILSAAYGHLDGNSGAGGGSTITQQLVKNTVVGDEISLERKWKELLSSTKLTATWDKDDIITSYLNTVYFGRGALGVEKASQAYFAKHASELDKAEAIVLAGIVQSPSVHDPAVNKKSAGARFNYVKTQMVKTGKMTQQEADATTYPKTIAPKPLDPSTGLTEDTGLIAQQALQELAAKKISKDDLFDAGATIVTTIDPRMQKVVTDASRGSQDATGLLAAVTTVDNATGAIKAMYGGEDGTGYDRTNNPQLTGSTFKIFTLAAGLEAGVIGLDTLISSDPYQLGNHTVGNSDGMSCGTCSVSDATRQSLNTSFYRIIDRLPQGAASVRSMAKNLGITEPLSEADGSVNHSITLGTYGTSMRNMASATSVLLNGGIKHDSHIVGHVANRNNQVIYKTPTSGKRVISQSTSDDVKTALAPIADMSNGNGIGKPSYAKTGTTEHPSQPGNRDGIMVGGSDSVTTAVWMGMPDGSGRSDLWGATHPGGLWSNIMRQIG